MATTARYTGESTQMNSRTPYEIKFALTGILVPGELGMKPNITSVLLASFVTSTVAAATIYSVSRILER